MSLFLVIVVALAIVVTQIFWAGAAPIYSYPGYILISLAGLASVALFRHRRVSPDRLTTIVVVAFALYVTIRALTSPVEYLARMDLEGVLACLVVYLIFALYVTEPAPRLVFLGAMLVLILPNVAIGLIHMLKDPAFTIFGLPRPDVYKSRASGLFICPNHYSGYLEIAGAFAVSLALWSRLGPMIKVLLIYLAAMAYGGILISGSRGGYLSVLASVAVLGVATLILVKIVAPHYMRRAVVGGVVAVLLAIAAVGFVLQRSAMLTQRSQSIAEVNDVRPRYWAAAWRQYQTAPVFGTGSRTYLIHGRMHRDRSIQNDVIYTHNDYLQLLAEYGLVGAVLGLGLLSVHLARCVRSIVFIVQTRLLNSTAVLSHGLSIQLGALGATVALAVHSVFDFNLHIPANALLMAAVLGMIANHGMPGARANGARPQRGKPLRVLLPVTACALLFVVLPRVESEYYGERARIELRHGDPGLAAKFAQRSLELKPQHPEVAFVLGEARRILSRKERHPSVRRAYLEASVAAFREGLRGSPNDVRLLLYLARTLDRLRRFDEASAVLQRALNVDPNFFLVYEHLGLHKHLQGALDEAETYYKMALALFGSGIAQHGLSELAEERKRMEQEKSEALE